MQMVAIRLIGGSLQRGGHLFDVARIKLHGFQIRKAPPGVAQRWCSADCLAIRRNTFFLTPDCLENVTIADPELRLLWSARQDALIEVYRLFIAARAGEHRRFGCKMSGIFRVRRKQMVGVLMRLGELALSLQHEDQVRACRSEIRRKLQRALQQALRIGIAAKTAGYFGEHADGNNIDGFFEQTRPQQSLCYSELVRLQRGTSLEQDRIANRSV